MNNLYHPGKGSFMCPPPIYHNNHLQTCTAFSSSPPSSWGLWGYKTPECFGGKWVEENKAVALLFERGWGFFGGVGFLGDLGWGGLGGWGVLGFFLWGENGVRKGIWGVGVFFGGGRCEDFEGRLEKIWGFLAWGGCGLVAIKKWASMLLWLFWHEAISELPGAGADWIPLPRMVEGRCPKRGYSPPLLWKETRDLSKGDIWNQVRWIPPQSNLCRIGLGFFILWPHQDCTKGIQGHGNITKRSRLKNMYPYGSQASSFSQFSALEALKSLVLLSGLFWIHHRLSVSRYLCWVSDMGWTISSNFYFFFFFFHLFFGNKKPDLSFWGRKIPRALLAFYNCTGIVLPQSLFLQRQLLFLPFFFFLEEKISHFLSVSYFLKCLPFFFAFSRLQHILVWWQNWAEHSKCPIFLQNSPDHLPKQDVPRCNTLFVSHSHFVCRTLAAPEILSSHFLPPSFLPYHSLNFLLLTLETSLQFNEIIPNFHPNLMKGCRLF